MFDFLCPFKAALEVLRDRVLGIWAARGGGGGLADGGWRMADGRGGWSGRMADRNTRMENADDKMRIGNFV